MSEAFVPACASLGLADRADPITELVARHIVEQAQAGVLTANALYLSAMGVFESSGRSAALVGKPSFVFSRRVVGEIAANIGKLPDLLRNNTA
jgi:hypothetical protein